MSLKRKRQEGDEKKEKQSLWKVKAAVRERVLGQCLLALHRATRRGSAHAQYTKAQLFLNIYPHQRDGGPGQNFLGTHIWFLLHKASIQGHVASSLLLGRMCREPIDGKRSVEDNIADVAAPDNKTSKFYYLFAAHKGNAEAQHQVAQLSLHDNKDGDCHDFCDVMFWQSQAAHQNHVLAQLEMGVYCMIGRHQNVKSAFIAREWFKKACLNDVEGPPGAMECKVANLYLLHKPDANLTKMMAWSWLEKGATKGYAKAQYMLAMKHWEGMGRWIKPNLPMALYWMDKAVTQEDALIQSWKDSLEKLQKGMKQEEDFRREHAERIKTVNAKRPQDVKNVLLDQKVSPDMVGEIMQYAMELPKKLHLDHFMPPLLHACHHCVFGWLTCHVSILSRSIQCDQCEYVKKYS